MALTTTQRDGLIKLYVGVFDFAPNVQALNFYAGVMNDQQKSLSEMANILLTDDQGGSNTFPAFLTSQEFVTKVFVNMYGWDATAITTNPVYVEGVTYWTNYLQNNLNGDRGQLITVTMGELQANGPTSTDATTVEAAATLVNKLTVAKHYVLDKAGNSTDLNVLRAVVNVDGTDASVTAAIAAIDNGTITSAAGQTFTLTTGIDNVTGTSGNDTILGSDASGATALVLGGLDVIDGGAGTDTLKMADAATAAGGNFSFNGATIKNVESIEVTSNGSFDVAANTGLSLKGYTGLTSATLKAAGTDNSLVLAADTTDVNLTVAGAATAGVTGGKAVSVTAGTGLVTVAGDALTTVSIKGGASTSSVTNTVAGAGVAGTTLTDVTFDGVATGTAAASGNAIANVTIKNQAVALATAVTNATSTALTVNVDNAGYTTAGAAVAGVSVAAGAAATTINLNAVSKSNVAVSGAAATTLNITGAGALTLSAPITTATKIDGSAATGALTLGVLNAATVTAKTGSGNDSLTLSATAKATVDTGAGNDSVTLASAVAAGSTITLGAGNDKLLVSTGSVAASTATAVTTVDAGDGTDTVAAALINAANAAQFKNFENIDVSATTPTALDIELMTGSTITGLTLTGGTGGATVNNVAAGVGLSVSGSNTGTTTIGVKSATTGTADSFTTTFAGTAGSTATATTPDTIAAGTVVTNGVESLNVVSGGTGFVTNTLAVTDSALQTMTITGDKGLALTFVGTNGTAVTGVTDTVNGVKMIDGSAATGVLNINTTNVTNVANAGLTVKTGSAKDVITLAQKATVDAGAGDDTITSAAAGGTFTGGTGNDKFDIKAAVATGATEATAIYATITDIAVGDTIVFDAAGSAFAGTKIALDGTVTNLDLALAAASNNTTAGQITWFQYGANTYIVENVDGTTGIDAGDVAIKLTGLIDLSNATYNATTDILTIA